MNEQPSGRTNGCLEASQLLAWHDGALSPGEATAVMNHMAGCARCAAEDRALLREIRQMFELLSRLDPLPDSLIAPEAALARFQQRLEGQHSNISLNHAHENRPVGEAFLAEPERVEVPPDAAHRSPRKSHVGMFVQVLAAVLVIGVLVGTLLALLTPYHSKPSGGTGAGTVVAEKGCLYYSKNGYVHEYDLSAVTADESPWKVSFRLQTIVVSCWEVVLVGVVVR